MMLLSTFALVVEEDGISVPFADAMACYCYLVNSFDVRSVEDALFFLI